MGRAKKVMAEKAQREKDALEPTTPRFDDLKGRSGIREITVDEAAQIVRVLWYQEGPMDAKVRNLIKQRAGTRKILWDRKPKLRGGLAQ